jgi:hypothetical protein
MNDRRITCVTKSPSASGHHHIVAVGVEGDDGSVTVPEIYALMNKGYKFHTLSLSGKVRSEVSPYTCCGSVHTLRSHADGEWDDNLDNLMACA